MDILQAIILGIIEGVTEFLPISSTGHLTAAEKIMGLAVEDPAITGFTAVIQVGAIAAAIVYFRHDIIRVAKTWFAGHFSAARRQEFDYRYGWYIFAGSIPIGIAGFVAKDIIKGPLRNVWVVAGALILWSGVMLLAEHMAHQRRHEQQLTLKDTLIIGLAQCLALIPGVSRSGATISVGLMRDIDRVTATRLSFFLAIPALTAAGLYELKDALSESIGITPLAVGTAVSFVVAYASIAWLLKFVSHHTLFAFVVYRVAVGVLLAAALASGWITAT